MADMKIIGRESFEDIDVLPEESLPEGICIRTDKDGNPKDDGDYIKLGSYPMSHVKDRKLINALKALAGDRPINGLNRKWTSYKYFAGDGKLGSARCHDDFMWFQELEYEGERYRAVTFNMFRPYYTNEPADEKFTHQKTNKFVRGIMYFFKYEPLLWQITERAGSMARVVSTMLIDAQGYQDCYCVTDDGCKVADSVGRIFNDECGNAIHANSYEYSSVAAWLNREFYETAFNDTEQRFISVEQVDNSPESTFRADNRFASSDTYDSIALMSYKEAAALSDAERCIAATDYAKCQGAYIKAGNSWWWLRSPCFDGESRAYCVGVDGSMSYMPVNGSNGGIRPIMWIRL